MKRVTDWLTFHLSLTSNIFLPGWQQRADIDNIDDHYPNWFISTSCSKVKNSSQWDLLNKYVKFPGNINYWFNACCSKHQLYLLSQSAVILVQSILINTFCPKIVWLRQLVHSYPQLLPWSSGGTNFCQFRLTPIWETETDKGNARLPRTYWN